MGKRTTTEGGGLKSADEWQFDSEKIDETLKRTLSDEYPAYLKLCLKASTVKLVRTEITRLQKRRREPGMTVLQAWTKLCVDKQVPNGSRTGPKWAQNRSQTGPRWTPNGSQMGPEQVPNGSRTGPKWAPNRPIRAPDGSVRGPVGTCSGPIWVPFGGPQSYLYF